MAISRTSNQSRCSRSAGNHRGALRARRQGVGNTAMKLEREQIPIGVDSETGTAALRRGAGDDRDSSLSPIVAPVFLPNVPRQTTPNKRPKHTHIFAPAEGLHYVDPEWL